MLVKKGNAAVSPAFSKPVIRRGVRYNEKFMGVEENSFDKLTDGASIISVPPDRYHRGLAVLETAFPDMERAFFYSITMKDPWYQPKYSLAVVKNHRYLSYLQIFDRTILFQNQAFRFGGIGSVGTRPDCRGRGYAGALLDYALRIMKEDKMKGSLLYTVIQPYYERFGWQVLPMKEQQISVDSLQHFIPHTICFRRLLDEDYPILHSIHTERQKFLSGLLTRNLDYWRSRLAWMNHVPAIVTENGKIVAYFYSAKFNLDKPVLTITEYGYTDSDDSLLALLFGVMAIKARENRCSLIQGFFRQDRVIQEFLDSRDLIKRENPYNYMMWNDVSGTNWPILRQAALSNQFLYWQTDAF